MRWAIEGVKAVDHTNSGTRAGVRRPALNSGIWGYSYPAINRNGPQRDLGLTLLPGEAQRGQKNQCNTVLAGVLSASF